MIFERRPSSASGRLPEPYGRLIDRSEPIRFQFDGRDFTGFAGDTLASALLDAGETTLSRSFKYRRPRGVLSLSGFDANALVQLGPDPNVHADTRALVEGLPAIESQNRVGSAAYDLGAWTQFLKRFMPVGFYYRSFFRPGTIWPFYERFFRARAGLGRVAMAAHHEKKSKRQLFCDVAVVGGGAAGLAAAVEAAGAGARVHLIEAMPRLGGAALYGPGEALAPNAALIREVEAHPNVTLMTDSIAQGLFDDHLLAVEAAADFFKIRAKAIVLATGAYEQPIIFRNNDLPGIMLASAARRLIWLYGVKPGTRAVVATVNDHGLETAQQLAEAGVAIAAVTDLRVAWSALHEALAAKGVPVYTNSSVYEAFGPRTVSATYFGGPVQAVRLAHLGASGKPWPARKKIACDLVVMAGGYAPAAELACHRGAHLVYDETIGGFRAEAIPDGVYLAGAAANMYEPGAVIKSGRAAGRKASAHCGFGEGDSEERYGENPGQFNHAFPIIPHPKGGEFVDLDEDLTIADIKNAIADGFIHGELLKRYSTAGMGPSQGRQAATAVLRIAARENAISPNEMGTTTVRPPLRGETFAHLAGLCLHPFQRTPMHRRHLELDAQMMPTGLWHRPAFYGASGNRETAIAAEASAVRTGAGLIDLSTLGKIEVMGPDAGRFLDAVYVTTHASQPIGRARYALRCDATGSIVDDGVVCRLSSDYFYLTTTTGQATATHRHMLWLKAQWRMDFEINNVTGAYAAVNLAGPAARDVIAKLHTDIDFSAVAFPYMTARMGTLDTIRARVIRVGFVGELGFEIHVPALFGEALWDRLIEAGVSFGLKPFGVEAQRLLRLEKGHAIIGQDTDGLTTPQEANMTWTLPKKRSGYWGCAAIEARAKRKPERLLVGFRITDTSAPPPPECCLIIKAGHIAGRVTSAAYSSNCGGVIGLAFLSGECAESGSSFQIKMPNGVFVTAKVVPTPFYDPGNERQKL